MEIALPFSCWEIVFSRCCDVQDELNLQDSFASNLRFLSQLFSSSGLSKYSKSCDAEGENSALFLGMAH